MGLIVSRKAKSNIPPLAAGVYTGTCIEVVDLGEQHNTKYNKYQRRVLLTWEIRGERVDVEEDGKTVSKPRWLSKEYTASLNSKSRLYEMLTAWLGRELTDEEADAYDISTLIGRSCQLQVIVKDKPDGRRYSEIKGIMALPKGADPGAPESDTMVFAIDEPDADEVIAKLPAWVQERVKKSTTWVAAHANSQDIDVDVPDGVDPETGEITGAAAAQKGPGF